MKSYTLASRATHPQNTIVLVGNVIFGAQKPVIIAGPCAIESEAQFARIGQKVKNAGAQMLRGGAYKPRTSPYAFQGLGEQGLKIMQKVGTQLKMPIVTEVISVDDLPLFKKYVDMIQIGSRNMHNFDLLAKAAKLGKPILLKRGMAATMEEFLCAAEYILKNGNPHVVLCERGIRTFEPSTRNTLDLNTLALIQKESHLPIIADPSHAAGRADLIIPLAKAALAVGAHGLIIEVHDYPEKALCDGAQSITPDQLYALS